MKRITVVIAAMLCVLTLNAQNLRRIDGVVMDVKGNAIPNASLRIQGTDKTFSANADGTFSIEIPTFAYAIVAESENFKPRFKEIDGTYMMFYLFPQKPNKVAEKVNEAWSRDEIKVKDESEAQMKMDAQKEAEAKAKADEQTRLIAQKEAEAKAKADEQARLIAQKEAEAKAKAEEQARLIAQKEAEAKAKAEEQARLIAQKEAEAKAKRLMEQNEADAKREEKLRKLIEKNLRSCGSVEVAVPSDSYASLGDRYLFGKELLKAFWCYNKGAEADEALAYMRLALFYETGREGDRLYVEKDTKMAIVFYEKAASLGLTDAEAGAARLRAQK